MTGEPVYMRDWVWMKPPDGEAEKVSTEGHEIGRRMAEGWKQIFPEQEKKES